MTAFKTISNHVSAEITEKKSRFIAQLKPVRTESEALSFLEQVRTEHRMARHNVYAYVLREGGRVRYSDDGEPSKTAGLPTLEVIQHAGLTDVAVVVTRYFGGTLLGTGGLVRAYTQAAQAAVDAADILDISRCVDISIKIPYALFDQVNHMAEQAGIKVVDPKFTDEVSVRLSMLEEDEKKIVTKLQELLRNQGSIEVGQGYEAAF